MQQRENRIDGNLESLLWMGRCQNLRISLQENRREREFKC